MSCPFCDLIASRKYLLEDGAAVSIEDAFPLNPGHALVVPRRHEGDFFALRQDEMDAVVRLMRATQALLVERHKPDGFNVGVNVGTAGGQTIDHVHLHVIPRYRGDVDDPRGGVRWIIPARAIY